MKSLRRLCFLFSLLLVVIPAWGQRAAPQCRVTKLPQPQQISTLLQEPATYGNCPDPYAACRNFHGEYSVPTKWCGYENCFDMSYGEDDVRVVAADDQGDFPWTWFVWSSSATPGPPTTCDLEQEGKKKTRVDIRVYLGAFRCKVDMEISGRVYHEHFASNPTTGCLGWLECTEYPPQ